MDSPITVQVDNDTSPYHVKYLKSWSCQFDNLTNAASLKSTCMHTKFKVSWKVVCNLQVTFFSYPRSEIAPTSGSTNYFL